MNYKKIAVLAGDGIGPEVTFWARKALNMVAKGFNHQFQFNYSLLVLCPYLFVTFFRWCGR